jgi:methyl-accepting chemotaxis protein
LNGTRRFYIARPLTISRESCLSCHGDPADAPLSMINTYGSEGGFGWELDETVAAQMMYVPADEVFNSARLSFLLVIGIFLVVFSIIVLTLNLVMRPTIVRPVSYLADLADKLGRDEITNQDLDNLAMSPVVVRGDEVGQLARTFSQMARQVQKREQALKRQVQELRVVIDSDKTMDQVSEITESEYFQELQQRAKSLRKRGQENLKD